MLVLLVALCGGASFLVMVIGQTTREPLESSITRATNYTGYKRNREDTLPNADLWEAKVNQGLSHDEAFIYTGLRPGALPSSTLNDSSALTDSARALLGLLKRR